MNTFTTSKPINPTKTRRRVASTALFASLLLAATACGSNDDHAASSATAAAPEATMPTPSTSTGPPPSSTTSTSTSSTSTSAAPATVAPTQQDEERRAALDGILASHLAGGEFVGARIALSDAEGNVVESTAGTTTVDPASAPVDLDTAWNIGSVTKTFVAVVVMQLAEEGLIDLDAGIDTYLPDLADAASITPRQLLGHASGLGEYNDKPEVLGDAHRVWSAPELIAVAEANGRVGEPGAAYHYSNTNYVVLGEIVEQITGTSWSDQVQTRIAEPLGLTNTGLLTDPMPVGYQVVDGALVDTTSTTNPSVGGAAGGLQSTGRDLLRFAIGLFDGSLLQPDSVAAMESFVPGDDLSQFGIVHSYGLGLERYATESVSIIGHMGTGEAQSAFIGYDPVHGTTVAVMTNTATAGPQAFMALEALTAAGGWG